MAFTLSRFLVFIFLKYPALPFLVLSIKLRTEHGHLLVCSYNTFLGLHVPSMTGEEFAEQRIFLTEVPVWENSIHKDNAFLCLAERQQLEDKG